MSGFLQDDNGNNSSKRLNQTIIVWGGLFIALFSVFMAFYMGEPKMVIDIGNNIVYLVGTLITLGIGGGVGVAFSGKKKEVKAK